MDVITPTDEALRNRAAAIAKALSDPKRLCVVEELAAGERSVSVCIMLRPTHQFPFTPASSPAAEREAPSSIG